MTSVTHLALLLDESKNCGRALYFINVYFNQLEKIQWKPVIRRPLGVGKYLLITGINYIVDMRTFFQMVPISGMFWYQVFL